MIIGLTGKAFSGKTSVANHIVNEHNYVRRSFAYALKMMLLDANVCLYDELFIEKTTHSRWLLQKIGTDIFREQVDPNYWVDKLLNNLDSNTDYVIDDIRFPNEAMAIRGTGGKIIKVECPNHPRALQEEAATHMSESGVDEITLFDLRISAAYGQLERLYHSIDRFMERIR